MRVKKEKIVRIRWQRKKFSDIDLGLGLIFGILVITEMA